MKLKKVLSTVLCAALLCGSVVTAAPQSVSAAGAAPEMLGTVKLHGDESFDSDSIKNEDSDQWRWLSYPESRILVNPGSRPQYDGGMNLNINLFVKGLKHIPTMQKITVGSDSGSVKDYASCSTAWYPYKLTAKADYASGASVNVDEFFADKDTFIRMYDVTNGNNQTVCLSLRDLGGFSVLDDKSVLVDQNDYWLIYRMMVLNEDGSVQEVVAPTKSGGDWKAFFNLTSDTAKLAFSMTLAPKNVDGSTQQTVIDRANASASGNLKEKLAATKAFWDEKLSNIPAPTVWGIQGGLDAKGVTEAQHRRSFYAAWAFNYQNILEPTPENGYPYYQVTLGKASGYTAGPTGAPNSCEWESMYDIQQLALVEPDIAWSAVEGFISTIEDSGKMPGESLPSQKAHTVWVCYQYKQDDEKLAQLYPKIKKYLQWRAENPHWGIGGRVYDDEKDISFVTQWYTDVNYAIEMCKVLGKYDDIAMWEDMKVQMGDNAREWFFKPASDTKDDPEKYPEDYIYNWYFSDTDKHYDHDRQADVENYICSALYGDFPADLMEKLIEHYVAFEKPDEDLVGFDFYKYGDGYNVANGLFEKGQIDSRLEGMWQRFTNATMRNVIKTVEFSEESRPNKYEPQGVQPSTFTASTVVTFTYMNNGVRIDLGKPVAIDDDGLTTTAESNIAVSTIKGTKPSLPKTVSVQKNGADTLAYVAWETIDESKYAEAGTFAVSGKIAGTDITATATISVYGGDVTVTPPVTATIVQNSVPTDLPTSLTATYEANGKTQNCIVHVVWDEMSPEDFATPGEVKMGGTLNENGQRIEAAITVIGAPVIESATGSLEVDRYDTLQLSFKDSEGNPIENVTWGIKDSGYNNIAGISQKGLLQAAKAGSITITATDNNLGVTVEQEITILEKNTVTLAYGGTATAISQADAARGPEKAVDEDEISMWRALTNDDSQWFQLEMNNVAAVTGLHIRWYEGNQPRKYVIKVSEDGTNWTTAYTQDNSPSSGRNDYSDIIVFDKTEKAKFIRMESSKAGDYQIGILEFQVFGAPEITEQVTNVSLESATGEFEIVTKNVPLQLIANVTPAGASDSRVVWSVTAPDGSATDVANISTTGKLIPNKNGTVKVTAAAIDGSGVSATQLVTITNQDTVNVALNKSATATTNGGGDNVPSAAIDGNMGTRWGSASGAPQQQHFTIDLQGEFIISSINLFFESALPVDYKLQYSMDNSNWIDIETVTGNSQQNVNYVFEPVNASYVRILTTKTTNNQWGFSIYEFEVYGKAPVPETTAKDVADGITELTAPAKGAEALTLPTVPEGFAVSIKSSSNETVIDLEGNITPAALDSEVKLVLTVSKGDDTADTAELTVTVPGIGIWKILLKQTIDAADAVVAEGFKQNIIPQIKTRFLAALAAAKELYTNPDATDEQLKAADDELILMMHYLEFTADKESLKAAIDAARDVINSGDYIKDEKMDAFIKAVDDAQALYDSDYTTDTEIGPAIDAMAEAQAALNPVVPTELDLSVLQHQINLSKKAYENLSKYFDGDAKNIFKAAYEKAVDVLAKAQAGDDTVDQAKVNEAAEALHAARAGLRLIPNKDELKNLLDNANATDFSEYTKESGAVLQLAIDAAQAVYDDPMATVEDVKAAEAVLHAAMDNLVPIKQGGAEEPGTEPPTGDTTPIAGLAVFAIAALGAVVFTRRKK